MGSRESQITVVDNTAESRYEARVDGVLAYLTYERTNRRITLIHTEVPAEIGGRGVAGALARYALNAARVDGLVVIPECEYVQAYIRRYPDYLPLVEPAWRRLLEHPER